MLVSHAKPCPHGRAVPGGQCPHRAKSAGNARYYVPTGGRGSDASQAFVASRVGVVRYDNSHGA